MFVVGDTRRCWCDASQAGFDPVKGYGRKERDLADPRVREAIKEIAAWTGALIVNAEGIVEKSCQLVDRHPRRCNLSKGLGARHWAGRPSVG